MTEEQAVYSVSQLNREAKRLLATHFLLVKVEGEISNFSAPSSGHWYFTLKDNQAQIRCAMFRGQQTRLGFKPSNGEMVQVSAQVSLYEPRGDYQLVVEQMEQAGDGALRQAFERLKQKLFTEGLFDDSRKQELPLIPAQIAVITSPSGAAVHDILTVLKRRFPAIPVVVYPVSVQGDSAKFEISAALQRANQRADADVIILARGGGSLEDLWAFNEEIVARAIAASRIPVISGVGHEVDVTIADFVADLRAATPSAAAERAVPNQQDWLHAFADQESRLLQILRRLLSQQRQRLDWLNKGLQLQHPGQRLQRNAQRLDELEQRLTQAMGHRLTHMAQRLEISQQRLLQHQPASQIHRHHLTLEHLQQRLTTVIRHKLHHLQHQQASLSLTLHAVSPLATLDRGYAIVQRRNDQSIVKAASKLNVGEQLLIRLAQGQLEATITGLD